mgnify:CR=1 FL=1
MLLVDSRWLIDKYSDKGWKDSIVLLDGSWYLPNLKRDPFKEYTELSIPFARFFNIDTVCDQKSNLPHTCLLYTSPSPRDGLLSRMPSSA